MNKVFLKDIKENKELLKKVFDSNERLKQQLYEDSYDLSMEQQLEFGELCLGKDHSKYIDLHEHYSSFFLTLKDSEKFILNIDKDYLSVEENKLYEKALKKLEKRDSKEYGSEQYYKLDAELDDISEELLKLIEKDLHDYENVDEEQVFEDFMFNLNNNYSYEDLYYLEDLTSEKETNYNLYEDINYTRDWN